MKRLLWAISTIPMVLIVGFLALIAAGVRMALGNYNPEMTMFFSAAALGFVLGVGTTVWVTQYVRRCHVSITHFRLRDLLLTMTILAITFGLMSFVLNKK